MSDVRCPMSCNDFRGGRTSAPRTSDLGLRTSDMDRLYRLDDQGTPRHAIERGGLFYLLDGDWLGDYRLGRELGRAEQSGCPTGFRILPPVVPTKIIGVGLNYRDHATETGKPVPTEPLIFLKPSTAVVAHGEPIRIP